MYDATINGSNFIYLNGTTQSVPYPVLHDLGSEQIGTSTWTLVGGCDATFTFSGTGNTFDLEITVAGTSTLCPQIYTSLLTSMEDKIKVSFDAVVTSGTPILTSCYNGLSNTVLNLTIVNGYNEFEIDYISSYSNIQFLMDGTSLCDVTVTNLSVKQITLPTSSYLTILQADGTIKQLSSTGDVGESLGRDPNLDDESVWTYANGTFDEVAGTFTATSADAYLYYSGTTLDESRCYTIQVDGTFVSNFYTRMNTTDDATLVDTLPSSAKQITTSGVSRVQALAIPSGTVISIFDVTEALPISTTYSQEDSHQFVFNSTSPLSDADISAIEADANLAFRMFFDGEVLPSGFSRANDMVDCNFFGGNEGLASGAYVQDLGTDLGADTYSGTMTAGGTANVITDLTGGNWNLDSEDTADTKTVTWSDSSTLDTLRVLIFDAIINSGTLQFSHYYDGSAYLDLPSGLHTVIEGENIVVIPKIHTTDTIFLRLVKNQESDVDINDSEVRELTAVEIQAYDAATRTTLANQTVAATDIQLVKDGSGRTTGTTATGLIELKTNDATIPTGWTIPATDFTVEELTDKGHYLYLSDGSYYLNGALSGSSYSVPSGAYAINDLQFDGTTAVLQHKFFSVIPKLITQTEATFLYGATS